MFVADLDTTIAAINALTARLAKGEDAEVLLQEALRLQDAHNRYVLNDLDATVGNRDQAVKYLADTYSGWVKGNAKRETILERIVQAYDRKNERLHEAIKPVRLASENVQQDRWAKEAAQQALADWAEGKDANLTMNRSAAQGEAYLAFLKQVAAWFKALQEERGKSVDEALRALVFQVMQYGVLHSDNSLHHTYQIRIGDLDEHLGKRAGAIYALRVIAPAALGVHEAQMLGIQREWYRN